VNKKSLFTKKLKKKNVVLMGIDPTLLEEFIKHSMKKKTFQFMEYSSFSRISATKYFNKILKKTKSPNNQFWQIVYKNNFAGTIALLNLKNKSVELRYAISHNFWNKGIFQICLDLILKLTKELKIGKIKVKTRIDNFASLYVLLKYKFKIRKVIKFKNNSIYYLLETK
jgi:RimJ/RimL family protein N-acetyltransferase